jgi:hypothetical protein
MGLLETTILHSQIENPAHRLDDKGRLIGCRSVQQHCHRRLEHLFYDATTKRFHNILLVRAQIAQAPAHAMNFTAAHGLKTLFVLRVTKTAFGRLILSRHGQPVSDQHQS